MIINWIVGGGLILSLLGFMWFLVKFANSQAPTGKKNEAKDLMKKIHTH